MGNFKKTFKPVHKGLFTSLRIHVMGGQLYLIMKDSYLPIKNKEILTRLSQHRQRYEIGLYNGAALYI